MKVITGVHKEEILDLVKDSDKGTQVLLCNCAMPSTISTLVRPYRLRATCMVQMIATCAYVHSLYWSGEIRA